MARCATWSSQKLSKTTKQAASGTNHHPALALATRKTHAACNNKQTHSQGKSMLHELRTYTTLPGAIPDVLKANEEVGRKVRGDDYGVLEGYWFTEIGPLNQVIQIWPYEDAAHREKVRVESAAPGKWPPQAPEKPVRMESEIFTPLPFIGDFASGNVALMACSST